VSISAVVAIPALAQASSIVYSCHDGDLCAVQPDGTHKRRLTTDGGGQDSNYDGFDLSDRGVMAFASSGRIYLADRNARHRTRLAKPKYPYFSVSPSFNPNATRLLFFHGIFGGPAAQQRICQVRAAKGVTPTCGKSLRGDRTYWGWGPEDTLVSIDAEERRDICVTSLNGGCKRVLVKLDPPKTFYLSPSLSPDGRTFATAVDQSDADSTVRISLFDARTGRHIRDVTHGHDDYAPDWSPDGRRLVFVRDAVVAQGGTESSFCAVAVTGGKVSCPVKKTLNVFAPVWGG